MTETTRTPTLVDCLIWGIPLLAVLTGIALIGGGYGQMTDTTEMVSVSMDIYVHEIPRDTAPNSAVGFRALSHREQDVFLAGYTHPVSWQETSVTLPAGQTAYDHLTQTNYVKYHGRWFSITTHRDQTTLDGLHDLASILGIILGILLVTGGAYALYGLIDMWRFERRINGA